MATRLSGYRQKEDCEDDSVSTSWPSTIHSCSFCCVQELDPALKRTAEDLTSGTAVRYRGSRLVDGALNGCAFFKDILTSLESVLKEHGYDAGSASTEFRPEKWIYELFVSDSAGKFERATGKWYCAIGELPDGIQQPQQEGVHHLVVADQYDPAAESIPIRPFLHDFGGQNSVEWAKRRLWECDMFHQDCNKPNPSFLPKRLLWVGTSEDRSELNIQLFLTASLEFKITGNRYAALSYCWGGPQEFQLTTDYENTLMSGLPISLLPRTLCDAIQVTWNLGMQWIWIDSLCIRQHDTEEKAAEIAQMHLIYKNSSITISATRASHCDQGFLHQCSLPTLAVTSYKLPFASPSGKLGSIILSNGGVVSPIDVRGWTLQEHLLARRVLRFTDFQLHWSCLGISAFESTETKTLPSLHIRNMNQAYKMYREIRANNRSFRHWTNLIEEYTQRALSDSLDKLPAISAIAEFWAGKSEDYYLAGLWASHLPLALLWFCPQPIQQIAAPRYCAPSWSWASLVGQVYWFDHWFTEVDPTLEVQSYETKLAHEGAPYGAIKAGSLIMQGLLQRTAIDDVEALPTTLNEGHPLLNLDLAEIHLDFGDEELPFKIGGSALYCLQVCRFDQTTGRGPSGLILSTVGDERVFTRVGFFNFKPPQKYEIVDLEDFDAMIELSKTRQFVQSSAFKNVSPRKITLI